MVVALAPLHKKYKIKKVYVSTYQAVSGAGKLAMDELFNQTKAFMLTILHSIPIDNLQKKLHSM